jgi:hypothetical protein
MATNKLPNMTANVTESTEDLWCEFIAAHRAIGLSRTKALEQAVRLWLDAQDPPRDNSLPVPVPVAGPFAAPVPGSTTLVEPQSLRWEEPPYVTPPGGNPFA